MENVVKFSSLGISPNVIIGDRISIRDILSTDILIYKVIIGESKFNNNNRSGLRMQMQIKIDGGDGFRSCFTGSDTLIGMMREAQGKRTNLFPLKTKIIKSGKMFIFT